VAVIKRYSLEDNINIPIKVIGVGCHYKMYRLAWAFNKNLNFHLRQLTSDFFSFPLYQYYERNNRITYSLIQNRVQGNVFTPEKKSIDYILVISSGGNLNIDNLVLKLRSMPFIIAVFEFQIADIPSIKKSLLYLTEYE